MSEWRSIDKDFNIGEWKSPREDLSDFVFPTDEKLNFSFKHSRDSKKDLENEVWKTVAEFPNFEVSNFGRVRVKETKVLRPHQKHEKGWSVLFPTETKKNKMRLVKRLVAEAFIPKPNIPAKRLLALPIDGDRYNHSLENLKWVAPRDNVLEKYKNGEMVYKEETYQKLLATRKRGSNNPRSIPCIQICPHTLETIAEYPSIREAAIALGKKEYDTANISKSINNPEKKAYGYYWEKKERK